MKTIEIRHGDILTYKFSGDHKWGYGIVINITKDDFMIIAIDNLGGRGYLIGSLPSNTRVVGNLNNLFSKTGNAYESMDKNLIEIG